MKKTLLSVIIASAASSVSATEVYNENGTTVNLNGEVKGLYERHTFNDKSTETLEMWFGEGFERSEVNPSAELKITGETDIGHGIKAFGSFKVKGGEKTKTIDPEITFDIENKIQTYSGGSYEREEEIKVEDIVLGFESDTGKLSLGKTDSSLDILGSANMTNELKQTYDYFQDANQARGIRAQANINNISLSLDFQDLKELKNGEDYIAASVTQKVDFFKYGATYSRTTDAAHNGSIAGVMAGIQTNGLDLVATFAKYKGVKTPKIDQMRFDIDYKFGDEIKHTYAYFDATVIALGASYTMDDFKLYGGYERIKSSDFNYSNGALGSEEIAFDGTEIAYNTYHLGAQYTLHDNFKVFAEGALKKGNWGIDDTGKKEYIVGGVYSF